MWGHEYLRSVAIVAVVMAVTMVTPLLPGLRWVTILWNVSVIAQGGYSGSVMAAIQVTVPNERRSLATALLLMSNLGALGLGSALIGAASSSLFAGDPAGVGKAFALVGIVGAILSASIAIGSIRRDARAI